MTASEKELLELAAKAAGYDANLEFNCDYSLWNDCKCIQSTWNPLTDDGDALRLAVKLCMTVLADPGIDGSVAAQIDPQTSPLTSIWADEFAEPDHYFATRRAIVRAAAEIGKEMK